MTKQRSISSDLLLREFVFATSRSGGPGGQNVNKVNTKVSLKFDVHNSSILTDDEKSVILTKLRKKINADGALLLTSQDKRSQLENKQSVMAKFDLLLKKAFEKRKARKATKPSKGAVQQRIKKKKEHSEKKKWRQSPY